MKGQLRLVSLLLMSASVCAIGLTSYTSKCSCSSEGKGTVSQNDGMPDGLSAAAHGAVGDQMVDQFKGGDSMPDGLSMTARGIGLRGNNPSQQMPIQGNTSQPKLFLCKLFLCKIFLCKLF